MILILKSCFESIVKKNFVSHNEMKMARNKIRYPKARTSTAVLD